MTDSADTSAPRPGRAPRLTEAGIHLVLAAVAYIPVFRTAPGTIAADTKSYLYIDPGKTMREAMSMWDPTIGMGTVTHQYIGYLFPMGPYYWTAQHLGIPMWVAQRFWLGSLFFFAGTGVLFMLRVLGMDTSGRIVAAIPYMLTPYVLSYAGRLSALLLPWSALGWMVGFVALSLRTRGWRYPAFFALVVAVAGTVNATSLIYAGVAPLLFVPYAVWVSKEASFRTGCVTVAKIGILMAGVSLWWIVGLFVEFAFALNILQYTEDIITVALTSLSSEVVRGLGYWFFYGEDQIDNYIQASSAYMTQAWLVAVSFALPAVELAVGILARWRYKAYFVMVALVGTILAVGAYPYQHASPFGGLLKIFDNSGIAGLALRSTNRAVPLIALALASLAGMGVSAVWSRWPWLSLALGASIIGLAAANLPSLWQGSIIGKNLLRPEKLPAYYAAEASYLNHTNTATRVLDEPGVDFASYRWGTTIDPVDPGLLTRPFVAREQVPYGAAASADLLNDFDETIQEGTYNPWTLAPMARLMSVGDIVLRSDLAFERYNIARPLQTWALFSPPPPGIQSPVGFGTPAPNVPEKYPLVDETALATDPAASQPPPLAVFGVDSPRPIVRSEPVAEPVVLSGDGMGVLAAAAAGLLDTNPTIFYTGSYSQAPAALGKVVADNADLVVTDTNYVAGRRWGTVRENVGYIQRPGESPLVVDPTDHVLPLFPGETTANQTYAQLDGVKDVLATSYGNPISFVPENQPYNVLDGNLDTVWTTGAFENPVGQRIRIELNGPVTADHIVLVQPLKGPRDRYITRITVTLSDPGSRSTWSTRVTLGQDSRSAAGQTVSFPSRAFSVLEIRVDQTNMIHRVDFAGVSGVGFAEIGIPGVNLHEVVSMPSDLLSSTGTASLVHRLVILMSRRIGPPVPPRTDPELFLSRSFTIPTARSFSVSGTARISSLVPDDVIDQLLGRPGFGPGGNGLNAYSSGRLPGDLDARASMAIDGNPATAWMPGIGPQAGGWIEVDNSPVTTFSHMDLQVVADGRHSVPTQVEISTENGSRTVELPPIPDRSAPGATVTVPVDFPPISGHRFRFTVLATRNVTNLDYYSGRPVIEPVGIAELGIPGIQAPPLPPSIPVVCRGDLVSIDGQPVYVAVSGSSSIASSETGIPLQLQGCGPDGGGISLGPGTHVVQTANGGLAPYGINIDTLNLASQSGGAPLPVDAFARLASPVPAASPPVTVLSQTSTTFHLKVTGAGAPFWLVLGESLNRGWTARITAVCSTGATSRCRPPGDAAGSLGLPELIDAYANGWRVPPAGSLLSCPRTTPSCAGPAGYDLYITLDWTPQQIVLPAIVASGAALALTLCLALWPTARWPRSRRARGSGVPRTVDDPEISFSVGTPSPPVEQGDPGSAERPDRRRRVVRVVVAASAMAALSGFFVSPLMAAPAGAMVLLAGGLRPFRVVLALCPFGFAAATAVYSTLEESDKHWHALFGWATHFQPANSLAWSAVISLACYGGVQFARRPPSGEPRSPQLGTLRTPSGTTP